MDLLYFLVSPLMHRNLNMPTVIGKRKFQAVMGTFHSHSASLHPGISIGLGAFNAEA